MLITKKTAAGLLSLGLVAGAAGAIGLSVHAQQGPATLPPNQQQAIVQPQRDIKSAADTDNIQDPAGQSEKTDIVKGQPEQPGIEAKDTGTEAKDSAFDTGHKDTSNIDHQFDGQE